MFTTRSLIAYLAMLGVGPGLAVDVRLYRGDNAEVDDFGRHAYLTRLSGPGDALQGLIDIAGWEIEVRGDLVDPDVTTEDLAMAIDARLLGRGGPAPWPVQVGDARVLAVVRSGGGPTVTALADEDDDLAPYVCTYLITTI